MAWGHCRDLYVNRRFRSGEAAVHRRSHAKDEPLLAGEQVNWSRIDPLSIAYCVSAREGPMWFDVALRVTFDEETGVEIERETTWQWFNWEYLRRHIRGPPRTIRTVLHVLPARAKPVHRAAASLEDVSSEEDGDEDEDESSDSPGTSESENWREAMSRGGGPPKAGSGPSRQLRGLVVETRREVVKTATVVEFPVAPRPTKAGDSESDADEPYHMDLRTLIASGSAAWVKEGDKQKDQREAAARTRKEEHRRLTEARARKHQMDSQKRLLAPFVAAGGILIRRKQEADS